VSQYFNLLTALENISQTLINSRRRQDFDVVLLDRGPFDSLVWFKQLGKLGLLSLKNRTALEDMICFPAWFANIRMVAFIDNDYATYHRRYLMDCTLVDSPKMPEEHFSCLRDAYREQMASTDIAATMPQFAWYKANSTHDAALDATDADMQVGFWHFAHEHGYEITKQIVKLLSARAEEHVATVEANRIVSGVVAAMDAEKMGRFVDSVFGSTTAGNAVPRAVSADSGQFVKYLPRATAEKTDSVVQLVAVAFVRHPDGGFYVFHRSKTEQRTQLAGKLTIVVGGHVDSEDRLLGEGGRNAVENCLYRELREELTHLDLPMLAPRFGIRVGDTIMGQRHLALVYEATTFSRKVSPVNIPGAGDFENTVQTMTLPEMVAIRSQFDDWSQSIIEQLASAP